VLAIHGSRSDGSAINQIITVPGRTITTTTGCMNVLKLGTAQGEYEASLTYAGAGTDVAGEAIGYGSWQPAVADITIDSI
jgi:hypothetical protein